MSRRILAGHGYWDVTSYPIGGAFRRAPTPAGVEVLEVLETFPRSKANHYTDTLGVLADGARAVFDSSHTGAA